MNAHRFNVEPTIADAPRLRAEALADIEAEIKRDGFESRHNTAMLAQWQNATDEQVLAHCVKHWRSCQQYEPGIREKAWHEWTAQHPRYRACSFDAWAVQSDAQREVLDKLKAFAATLPEALNRGQNVVLFGAAGTGKDFAMACLLREISKRVTPLPIVRWIGGENVRCARFEDVHADPFAGAHQADVQRLLCISDPVLSGSPLAFAGAERFQYLLDVAYRFERPVWITVNAASRAELDTLLGVAAADRLVDGACTAFLNWPSFRKKAA